MRARSDRPEVEGARSGNEILDAARTSIPALPLFHVARPRVTTRLQGDALVTLVSAPAGTGKTTVVAEWVRAHDVPDVGWISFDDDDPTFWQPVLQSLSRIGVDIPPRWIASTDLLLGQQRLHALRDLVAAAPRRLTLVIDGYELTSRELGDEIDYLLRRSQGRVRLVLVGRVDPVFPLYRYALTDSLVEVRAAHLFLNDAEAGELFHAAGVSMGADEVAELNERLHGWAAALRLVGPLSSGTSEDSLFSGAGLTNSAAVNEFLIGEVLNRQPPELRRVVLATSVPEVLSPELADEIAGPLASRAFDSFTELRSLVEPLPGEPGWFRYPSFVRELLRAQLAYESPEIVQDLHGATARWLWSRGLVVQALGHLAKIEDWPSVVEHIVDGLLVGRLLLEGPHSPLSAVAGRVPPDLGDPATCLVRATVALAAGNHRRCDKELATIPRAAGLEKLSPAFGLCLAAVDAYRSSRSGSAARAGEATAEAERRLAELLEDGPARRTTELATIVKLSKGGAVLRRGELDEAEVAYEWVSDHVPPFADLAFRAECLGQRAVVEALQGHCSTAIRSAEESLSYADEAGLSREDASPGAHVALALVGVSQDEIGVARTHIRAAEASRHLPGDRISAPLLLAAGAEIDRAEGKVAAASSALQAAADSAGTHDPWLADQLRVKAARFSLTQGEPDEALAVLGAVNDDDCPEVALVAAGAYAEKGAAGAVDGLLAIAARGEQLETRVGGLLVETLQRHHEQSPGRARTTLDKALKAARPESLRRPFRDASPAVQRCLTTDTHFFNAGSWLDPGRAAPPSDESDAAVVVERLTAKELEVLGHLADLLTTEEIAEKMFVSVNTVRTHIRSVLRKLGVSRRNAAIRRARALGILET